MLPLAVESGGYICIYLVFKLSLLYNCDLIVCHWGFFYQFQINVLSRFQCLLLTYDRNLQVAPAPPPLPSSSQLVFAHKNRRTSLISCSRRHSCPSDHCASLSFSNVSKKLRDVDALLGFYHLKAKTGLSPGGSPFSCCYDRYSRLTWNRSNPTRRGCFWCICSRENEPVNKKENGPNGFHLYFAQQALKMNHNSSSRASDGHITISKHQLLFLSQTVRRIRVMKGPFALGSRVSWFLLK